MNDEKQISLIKELYNCAIECSRCAAACLNEQDVKMLARCISLDLDCADVCRTAASLLSRGSKHGIHLLSECAELCNICAEECEKHARMEHCRKCGEACRACAEACQQPA